MTCQTGAYPRWSPFVVLLETLAQKAIQDWWVQMAKIGKKEHEFVAQWEGDSSELEGSTEYWSYCLFFFFSIEYVQDLRDVLLAPCHIFVLDSELYGWLRSGLSISSTLGVLWGLRCILGAETLILDSVRVYSPCFLNQGISEYLWNFSQVFMNFRILFCLPQKLFYFNLPWVETWQLKSD